MYQRKYKYTFACVYSIFLILFTTYVLLDTFVIARQYTKIESSSSNNHQQDNTSSTETKVTDTSYQDEAITIEITTYRAYDTNIYVADIQLSDPSYLKTALAQDSYGKNIVEKTSTIAKNHQAILAINGDYYGVREKGYVLRNGVMYRSVAAEDQEDLVIYEDGTFEIIKESEIGLERLLAKNTSQVFSFGPSLLIDNQIQVQKNTEVGKAMVSNPRTAIGILEPLHYLFVVSDGRTTESVGLSLYELAEFMQTLEVEIAYNLDGGGSSTMYFLGKVINQPTTNGKTIKERRVSDIVYIG